FALPVGSLPSADIELLQFVEQGFGCTHVKLGCAPGGGIMQTDYPAILCQTEIRFDAVGPLLPGQAEGGQRVLRRLVRGPAVGYQQSGFSPVSARHKEPLSHLHSAPAAVSGAA